MNCNHCRTTVEQAIQQVEGVTTVSVSLATGEAHVEGTASRQAICQAIEQAGFTVRDVAKS